MIVCSDKTEDLPSQEAINLRSQQSGEPLFTRRKNVNHEEAEIEEYSVERVVGNTQKNYKRHYIMRW